MKFKWSHALCMGLMVTCLSGVASASRLPDVRSKICIGIDGSGRPVFSTRYNSARVNSNFTQAKCEFWGKYDEIRENMRFNTAVGQALAMKHHNDLMEVYKREVLKKVNEPEIVTNCLGFSVIMENILNECGIENYTLSIGGPNEKNGHAANLYRLNGKWYVADATADVCARSSAYGIGAGKEVTSRRYLQIPLTEYHKILEGSFGFSKNVLIGVNVGLDSEVKVKAGCTLPLDAFMQFYGSADMTGVLRGAGILK